jgi:hypothetical protein
MTSSYKYNTITGHTFNINCKGIEQTYVFDNTSYVTLKELPCHLLNNEELNAMGVPEDVQTTYMNRIIYYIDVQPYNGPIQHIYIESQLQAMEICKAMNLLSTTSNFTYIYESNDECDI